MSLDISLLKLQPIETFEDAQISPELSPEKQGQLKSLLGEFADVLTD